VGITGKPIGEWLKTRQLHNILPTAHITACYGMPPPALALSSILITAHNNYIKTAHHVLSHFSYVFVHLLYLRIPTIDFSVKAFL